jgi:Tfp pilus assembly protein PilF
MLRTNDDGSISCFLGTLDLPSRTQWSVEVLLPADKSYFLTRSKWDNTSVTEQSYYQWMNAGVKTAGNLEYIYPGKNYLGHNGRAFTWPVDDKGRELAWYEKNNFGSYKSYHVFGSYTDFFGGYWHDDDFGFGHYARYDDKPGKKIWIWGLSQQGMIWESLLTDNDGQYSEIQSGRLFNQGDAASTLTPFKHRDFTPATTDLFEEYWFPVNATRGLKNGLPAASVNLTRENEQLVLRVCPNIKMSAQIEVRSSKSIIFTQQIQTVPQKTMGFEINSKLTVAECTVWLEDQLLYDGNPARSHTLRPTHSPAKMDWNSAYGHYLRGKEWERQRRYQKAHDEYHKCLSIEPCFVPALDGMAHLYFRRGENKKSREFALRALAVDTYDGSANYYYGLSSLALGDTVSALDGLSVAAAALNYRSAAYNSLAGIYLSKQNYMLALDYAEGSKAQQLEAIALRLSSQTEQAEQKLVRMELSDPLNHFCRIERYIANPIKQNVQEVIKYIGNEFPFQIFLEYAIGYHAVGQNDAAQSILELAPAVVTVNYWLAYLLYLNGEKSRSMACLEKALTAEPTLVFPYRNETKIVLEWALNINHHWKTKYYLGLVQMVQLNPEKALSIWRGCKETPDFYPFYIARARLNMQKDPEAAARDLELALRYGKSQWQAGRMVAGIYEDLGKSQLALDITKKFYVLYPTNYYLGLQYAYYLNKAGQFAASIEILKKTNVLPNEGATTGRVVWRNSNLNLAIDNYKNDQYSVALVFTEAARQFPINLGVGKTYFTDERLEDFIAALCYGKMNKHSEAAVFESKIITTITDRKEEIPLNSGDLITAFLLRNQNKNAAAAKLMSDLLKMNPDHPGTRWSMAIFNADYDTAGRIAGEYQSVRRLQNDQSFPILLRLHNECGVFYVK